jgi:hypothetical protein
VRVAQDFEEIVAQEGLAAAEVDLKDPDAVELVNEAATLIEVELAPATVHQLG